MSQLGLPFSPANAPVLFQPDTRVRIRKTGKLARVVGSDLEIGTVVYTVELDDGTGLTGLLAKDLEKIG